MKLEGIRGQVVQNHSLELLKFVSNRWLQNHEKRAHTCEEATKENEDPCAIYEFVQLVRAQIIEPVAVSHPDIAKFLDNVHLSLL